MEKQSPNIHWLLPVDETGKRLIVEILGSSFSSSSPLRARILLYSSHRSSLGSRLCIEKPFLTALGKVVIIDSFVIEYPQRSVLMQFARPLITSKC